MDQNPRFGRTARLLLLLALIGGSRCPATAQAGNRGSDNGVVDRLREIDLEEAKELAIANSHALGSYRLYLEASARLHLLSARGILPAVEIGYSENDTVAAGGPDSRTKVTSLVLRQPLFNGGLTIRRRKLARLQLLLDEQRYDEQRETVLDDTCRLFHRLLVSGEKQRLQKSIHDVALKELEIASTQWEAGVITRLDLVETRLEVRSLELDLSATEMEIRETEYRLKQSLGIPYDAPVQWQGSIDREYVGMAFHDSLDRLCGIVLANNPDLKRQRFAVERSRVETETGRNYPKIAAEISFTLAGSRFPLQEPGYSVELLLSFPGSVMPFRLSAGIETQGRTIRSGTLGAAAEPLGDLSVPIDRRLSLLALEEEERREEQLAEELLFSVRREVSRYRRLIETLQLRREYLAWEEEKLEILRRQLELGEIKRIDFLKAQTRLLNDEIEFLGDVLAVFDAERAVEKLAGSAPGELRDVFTEGKGTGGSTEEGEP